MNDIEKQILLNQLEIMKTLQKMGTYTDQTKGLDNPIKETTKILENIK